MELAVICPGIRYCFKVQCIQIPIAAHQAKLFERLTTCSTATTICTLVMGSKVRCHSRDFIMQHLTTCQSSGIDMDWISRIYPSMCAISTVVLNIIMLVVQVVIHIVLYLNPWHGSHALLKRCILHYLWQFYVSSDECLKRRHLNIWSCWWNDVTNRLTITLLWAVVLYKQLTH
jgi:hypothetical protein